MGIDEATSPKAVKAFSMGGSWPKYGVAVAMSGGVDSTVAAALLKQRGHEVVGLTLTFSTESRCCAEQDVVDARRMADRLGIPHHVVPLPGVFEERVVHYFLSEYRAGRTPNPCAVCNAAVKFGSLFEEARSLGASHLATGHYARVRWDPRRGRWLLQRGLSRTKDQSYFLARLSQEMLSRSLFPLGGYSKGRIRKMAESLGLDVAHKRESQDVCFVPRGGLKAFLEDRLGPFPEGPIRDASGRILGKHRGMVAYTIGQRKGLGVGASHALYVTRLDPQDQSVYVGPEAALFSRGLVAQDPNWIAMDPPQSPLRAGVRIRYRHRAVPAWIVQEASGMVHVRFEHPQRAVTPGQLAVFYDGDVVIGSAWIKEAWGEW